FGPLAQVRRGGAPGRQQPSLDDELGGEGRLVMRGGAGQDICPRLTGRYGLTGHTLTVQTFTATATPQLVVPMTTKGGRSRIGKAGRRHRQNIPSAWKIRIEVRCLPQRRNRPVRASFLRG